MLYSCSLEHGGLDLGRKQGQLYKCFGHLYWWNTISRIKPHPCISNSMPTLNLRTRGKFVRASGYFCTFDFVINLFAKHSGNSIGKIKEENWAALHLCPFLCALARLTSIFGQFFIGTYLNCVYCVYSKLHARLPPPTDRRMFKRCTSWDRNQ